MRSTLSLFLAYGCIFGSSLAFTVLPRFNHQAVLINNTVMIYGGSTSISGAGTGNDLIFLPVDQVFQTSSPPYLPTSGPQESGPAVAGTSLSPGGSMRNELFVYGGNIPAGVQLEIYQPSTGVFVNATWPAGSGPAPRDSHTVVNNVSTGFAYIFGGETASTALNDLWILNTVLLQWSNMQSSAPLARQAHASAITTDGRMVVIGGTTTGQNPPVALTNIDVYDTLAQQWSKLNLTTAPPARLSHTAVCTQTNKVIVFGGDDGNGGYLGDLIVLDMSSPTPSWSQPAVTGVSPTGRYGHASVMVGTMMILSYGKTAATTLDSNIYVLDTATFAWTTSYNPTHLEYTWSFTPPLVNSTAPGNPSASGNNPNLASPTVAIVVPSPSATATDSNTQKSGQTAAIVGSLVGVIGAIAIAAVVFFLYRRSKNRSKRYTNRHSDLDITSIFEPPIPSFKNGKNGSRTTLGSTVAGSLAPSPTSYGNKRPADRFPRSQDPCLSPSSESSFSSPPSSPDPGLGSPSIAPTKTSKSLQVQQPDDWRSSVASDPQENDSPILQYPHPEFPPYVPQPVTPEERTQSYSPEQGYPAYF